VTLLHAVNLTALLLLTALFVLVTALNLSALVFLILVLFLLVLYRPLRHRQNFVACYFALSFSVLLWIIVCENVVTIDNVVGTQITRKLSLGLHLQTYVDTHFKESARKAVRQPCCDDPLAYNLKAGSKYEETYDCPTCNAPYKVVVDETGYLNRPGDFLRTRDQIDFFIAGDSVIQGLGGPSVIDFVKERLPVTMWSLSLSGYGPRQKIDALLTYALPKHPHWLVVDFFSGNDATDAIEDEVCDSSRDFRCRFSLLEMRRRLLAHPMYSRLLDPTKNPLSGLSAYGDNYFTVAVTNQVLKAIGAAFKKGKTEKISLFEAKQSGASGARPYADMAHPAELHVKLIRGKTLLDWVTAGMVATHAQYEHLVAALPKGTNRPTVILLYNPSAYEIYRGIVAEQNTQYDEAAQFQVEAQRAFASKSGWIFLDLTPPLREVVKDKKTWLYGRYDSSHWSHEGTPLVTSVFVAELKKVMGK